MKIKYVKISKNYIFQVIKLLSNNISNYTPKFRNLSSIWKIYSSQKNTFAIVALNKKNVIGYGFAILEVKIRGGIACHIEDIAIEEKYRKFGIGKSIMQKLFKYAKMKKCYKISLQCKHNNVKFYKNCGYEINGVTMQKLI
jgi:ribosomal protein S18 acetylase RimI-like enzyme